CDKTDKPKTVESRQYQIPMIMRTLMLMKWDGVQPDQYEKLRKTVNWEGNVPQGAVFHVAGFTSNGIRVTDIWESVEECNNFVQKRLLPATVQLGIKTEPQVEFVPLHAVFVPALIKSTTTVPSRVMENA